MTMIFEVDLSGIASSVKNSTFSND